MTRRNDRWIIPLLLAITAISVCVAVWALFFREPAAPDFPDYPPQQLEDNAVPIPDDGQDELEAPEGGGAVGLVYSNQVSVDLQGEQASLLFANPGKSTQDMMLQILVQDTVIASSGRLVPGKQIQRLPLLSGVSSQLSPGSYEGTFVVSYLNQDTGEKAILTTEIPVTITTG
ncbi:MAG: hypothetical protein IKB65_03145 [Ruminiclostridium sp.]|nr:hypothetical protein [Ruminiclostridium sp.]